jgi:hypothetical protein
MKGDKERSKNEYKKSKQKWVNDKEEEGERGRRGVCGSTEQVRQDIDATAVPRRDVGIKTNTTRPDIHRWQGTGKWAAATDASEAKRLGKQWSDGK